MKCDICGKPATVHLTEIINDQMSELHLCEECANKKGAQVEHQFGLADMLSGLTDDDKSIESEPYSAEVCASCGMSYEDFRRVGRLGCADCYDAFGVGLRSLLKRIHGSPKHLGKSPHHPQAERPTRDDAASRLRELKRQLKTAISKEAFEEAAALRDQIHTLQQTIERKTPTE